ncbi:hypothetical protein B0H14DRAFT_3490829 [Mycena olivaceomarginata]|nr:hypothetical protein B0H14DRAFT_3490829 [Mycena olivaceomarginata]
MARAAFRFDLACRKSGKVAKGENFWGQVDEWFKKVAERGSSLMGPKWRSYIDQRLLDDRSKFKGLTLGAAVLTQEN